MPKLRERSVCTLVALTLFSGVIVGVLPGQQSAESYSTPTKNTCGPDALSAALAQFKIDASPGKISQLADSDDEGTTMLGLKKAAQAFGVEAVGLRLSQKELESYVQQGRGVIAFVNHNHYVWIKSIGPQGILIKDMDSGFQLIPFEKWYFMWFQTKKGEIASQQTGRGLCLVIYPTLDSRG